MSFVNVNASSFIGFSIWVCKTHEKLKTPRHNTLRNAAICFEYFPDQSVIHAARQDWVAEFSANNIVDSAIAGYRPFDINREASVKRVRNLFYAWVISISLYLVSLETISSVGKPWGMILATTCAVVTISFIVIFMIGLSYLVLYKLPILREVDYFGKKLRESWRDYLRGSYESDFTRDSGHG